MRLFSIKLGSSGSKRDGHNPILDQTYFKKTLNVFESFEVRREQCDTRID